MSYFVYLRFFATCTLRINQICPYMSGYNFVEETYHLKTLK